jgi:hypothetical protein
MASVAGVARTPGSAGLDAAADEARDLTDHVGRIEGRDHLEDVGPQHAGREQGVVATQRCGQPVEHLGIGVGDGIGGGHGKAGDLAGHLEEAQALGAREIAHLEDGGVGGTTTALLARPCGIPLGWGEQSVGDEPFPQRLVVHSGSRQPTTVAPAWAAAAAPWQLDSGRDLHTPHRCVEEGPPAGSGAAARIPARADTQRQCGNTARWGPRSTLQPEGR